MLLQPLMQPLQPLQPLQPFTDVYVIRYNEVVLISCFRSEGFYCVYAYVYN